jgi:hypothetical protein
MSSQLWSRSNGPRGRGAACNVADLEAVARLCTAAHGDMTGEVLAASSTMRRIVFLSSASVVFCLASVANAEPNAQTQTQAQTQKQTPRPNPADSRPLSSAPTPSPISFAPAKDINPAQAGPATTVDPIAGAKPESTPSYSYSNQVLATDLGALGLGGISILLAASSKGDAALIPLVLAGGTYVFGGPIVHAAHSRFGTAAGSLALRIGLPGLGAGIGFLMLVGDDSSGWEGFGRAMTAVITAAALGGLGAVGASIIDITMLARPGAPPPASPTRTALTIAPMLDHQRSAAGMQLVGSW